MDEIARTTPKPYHLNEITILDYTCPYLDEKLSDHPHVGFITSINVAMLAFLEIWRQKEVALPQEDWKRNCQLDENFTQSHPMPKSVKVSIRLVLMNWVSSKGLNKQVSDLGVCKLGGVGLELTSWWACQSARLFHPRVIHMVVQWMDEEKGGDVSTKGFLPIDRCRSWPEEDRRSNC